LAFSGEAAEEIPILFVSPDNGGISPLGGAYVVQTDSRLLTFHYGESISE
jgi:hypothetical protein